MYSLSEMPSWKRRLARRSISHETYVREVDSQLVIEFENQPSTLPTTFFEDGGPTAILTGLTRVIRESWSSVVTNGETLQGVYVQCRDNDNINTRPLTIAVQYDGEYTKGTYLKNGLIREIENQTSQSDIDGLKNSEETIDLKLFNVKPYGLLLDIEAIAWYSFGRKTESSFERKTEIDHSDFLWLVHGLD